MILLFLDKVSFLRSIFIVAPGERAVRSIRILIIIFIWEREPAH